MLPWILLDSAPVPGDANVLKLMRRGDEFSIRLGGNELMNSRMHGSEEALARMPCEQLLDRRGPAVLIGGLGMGFTLRAALAILPADARVVVSELVPAVVDWARGPMAEFHKGSLEDPRVTIRVGDVADVIGETPAAFDAILMDVDNGPEALTRADNDDLYTVSGLVRAKRALRSRGILAVWSQGPEGFFTPRLRKAGFRVEEVMVRARGKAGGARHRLWLAERQ
jgi:spermidine synthase